jgi:hypothetical protein
MQVIYISEIAPAQNRGMLVSLNEMGITVGIFIAYLVNYAFITVPHGWRYVCVVVGGREARRCPRLCALAFGVGHSKLCPAPPCRYMFGISVVPAIVQGIGMFFLPKSPRWLVLRHRFYEVRRAHSVSTSTMNQGAPAIPTCE